MFMCEHRKGKHDMDPERIFNFHNLCVVLSLSLLFMSGDTNIPYIFQRKLEL